MARRILAVALAAGLWSSAAIAADLSLLKVFPNPVRMNIGDRRVTFDNVNGGELKIFNVAGRLVFEATLDSSVSSFIWDLKNNDGRQVASGIYIYLVESGADVRTGKIGVIR